MSCCSIGRIKVRELIVCKNSTEHQKMASVSTQLLRSFRVRDRDLLCWINNTMDLSVKTMRTYERIHWIWFHVDTEIVVRKVNSTNDRVLFLKGEDIVWMNQNCTCKIYRLFMKQNKPASRVVWPLIPKLRGIRLYAGCWHFSVPLLMLTHDYAPSSVLLIRRVS